jgi:hypothetical protein
VIHLKELSWGLLVLISGIVIGCFCCCRLDCIKGCTQSTPHFSFALFFPACRRFISAPAAAAAALPVSCHAALGH